MGVDYGYGDVKDDGCCSKCGHKMESGDFPFCPHGVGGLNGRIHDDIPGGVIVENYGPDPIRFDSHTDRRKYMAVHGLREKEKFSPMPGTGKDPAGIPNPAGYMDPQTLLNAAALICRNGAQVEFDGVRDGVMTIESGHKTIAGLEEERGRSIVDA